MPNKKVYFQQNFYIAVGTFKTLLGKIEKKKLLSENLLKPQK